MAVFDVLISSERTAKRMHAYLSEQFFSQIDLFAIWFKCLSVSNCTCPVVRVYVFVCIKLFLKNSGTGKKKQINSRKKNQKGRKSTYEK